MFKWFRRRREEALVREFLPAFVQGEKYQPIRDAFATIDITISEIEPDAFSASAAGDFVKYLCRTAGADITNDDDVFVAGIHTVVVADFIAQRVGGQFEMASSLGLFRLVMSKEEFERIHTSIIDSYNDQVSNGSKPLQAIGVTFGTWLAEPTQPRLDRVIELFQIYRKSVITEQS